MALRHCQGCDADVSTRHRLPMWFLIVLIPLALITGMSLLLFDVMVAIMVGEEASLLSYAAFLIMASPIVYVLIGWQRRCPYCRTPQKRLLRIVKPPDEIAVPDDAD